MGRRTWAVSCRAVADGHADKFAAMRVAELGNAPQIASAEEAIRLSRSHMTKKVREQLPGRTLVDWHAEEET